MKFVKHPNDQVVIAKRVAIELERFKDIIQPLVETLTVEPIAVAQDIDKNAEHRLFLYHGNSGMSQ